MVSEEGGSESVEEGGGESARAGVCGRGGRADEGGVGLGWGVGGGDVTGETDEWEGGAGGGELEGWGRGEEWEEGGGELGDGPGVVSFGRLSGERE